MLEFSADHQLALMEEPELLDMAREALHLLQKRCWFASRVLSFDEALTCVMTQYHATQRALMQDYLAFYVVLRNIQQAYLA